MREGNRLTSTSRYCVLLLGLAMALAMSSVVRADAVTDWNAIAIQIIANAPCPAAPCANPPVHPGATATLDSAMVQAAVYDAVESITGRFRPYAVHVPGASGSTAAAVAKAIPPELVDAVLERVREVAKPHGKRLRGILSTVIVGVRSPSRN